MSFKLGSAACTTSLACTNSRLTSHNLAGHSGICCSVVVELVGLKVMYTKVWPGNDAPVLIGSAFVSQMVQGLGCCERRRWGGYSVTNLLEVHPVERTSQEITKAGEVFG